MSTRFSYTRQHILPISLAEQKNGRRFAVRFYIYFLFPQSPRPQEAQLPEHPPQPGHEPHLPRDERYIRSAT